MIEIKMRFTGFLPSLWAIPGGSSYTSSLAADVGAKITISKKMVIFLAFGMLSGGVQQLLQIGGYVET